MNPKCKAYTFTQWTVQKTGGSTLMGGAPVSAIFNDSMGGLGCLLP